MSALTSSSSDVKVHYGFPGNRLPSMTKDFQPFVESTVVEFAVLFYLPEMLGGDSPTVNIVIIHR